MKNYDPHKESSYIMYLDANNLYGWAMSRPLPYIRNFRWLSDSTRQNKPKTISEWLQYINTKNMVLVRSMKSI